MDERKIVKEWEFFYDGSKIPQPRKTVEHGDNETSISATLVSSYLDISGEIGVSESSVLLSIFTVLLQRYTGQSHLPILKNSEKIDVEIDEKELLYDLILRLDKTSSIISMVKYQHSISLLVKNDSVTLMYPAKYECMRHFLDSFVYALSRITKNVTVGDMDIIDPVIHEKHISGKCVNWDENLLMHQFFEKSCDKTPDSIAITVSRHNDIQEQSITYKELEQMSNMIADYLLKNIDIVGPYIGVLCPNSHEQIAAMLGIHKAGLAYVGLDIFFPQTRIDSISEMLNMSVCLCLDDNIKPSTGEIIIISDIIKGDYNKHRPVGVDYSLDNMAYVLFTSGSTGKPKGVEVTQRTVSNLGNFLMSLKEISYRRVLQASRISWDVSVSNIIMAFSRSGTLCLINHSYGSNPSAYMSEIINSMRVNTMMAAPSFLSIIRPEEVPSISDMIVAGDVLDPREAKIWEDNGIKIWNSYGPTETINVTFGKEEIYDGYSPATIGSALPNVFLYILSPNLKCQPIGVQGELYVSGIHLAAGYYKVTDKSFTENPFKFGERMYRTGDIVSARDNGQIDFHGRSGTGYVKIRGFRIELDEINSVVSSVQGVKSVVSVADRGNIVTFYTGSATEKSILNVCKEKLTDYSVPKVVNVPDFPFDDNGKIDKRQLVQNLDAKRTEASHNHNLGPLGLKVAAIWNDVLGFLPSTDVNPSESFFSVGGHSITASMFVWRIINELRLDANIKEFFINPTLEYCLERPVMPPKEKTSTIQKHNLSTYKITKIQELFLGLNISGQDRSHIISLYVHMNRNVDRNRLEESFRKIMRLNPVLCTSYLTPETPIGKVNKEWIDLFKVYKISSAEVQDFQDRPFNLRDEPSFRAAYVDDDDLLIVFNHITIDGGCLRLFLNNLIKIYKGVNIICDSFVDYAQDLSEEPEHPGLNFWLNQTKEEKCNLPENINIANDERFIRKSVEVPIPDDIIKNVNDFTKRGISKFILYLCSFSLVMNRFGNTDFFNVGIPVTTRNRPELLNIIGCFANTAVIGMSNKGLTIKEYLKKYADFWAEAQEYTDVPYIDIARRIGSSQALYSAEFNYESLSSDPIKEIDEHGLFTLIDRDFSSNKYADPEIKIYFKEGKIKFEYQKRFSCMKSFMDSYFHVLRQMFSIDLDTMSDDLELISREVHTALISGPRMEWSKNLLMHQFFEKSCDKFPNNPAVMINEKSISYRELDRASNMVAHYLFERREEYGRYVGVLCPAGFEQIAAILGIQKAGMAYVGLDIYYPRDRLNSIVDTLNLPLCLTHKDTELLPERAKCIKVEEITRGPYKSERLNLKTHSLDDRAYILFTSGSTGTPKGVEISHRGVSNLGNYWETMSGFSTDRVLQMSRISWDGSISNFLLAFGTGGTLCLLDPSYGPNAISHVSEAINIMKVTMMDCPPSVLSILSPKEVPSVRSIIVGGDVLCPGDIKPWEENDVKIFNSYGPTEATVNVTIGRVKSGPSKVTIGKSLPNIDFYILNENLKCQPTGVPGELYVGGSCLALGYYKLESDAFVELFSEKMYRTGDIVSSSSSGDLFFHGRSGNGYVKVRGYRIELNEVNSTVESHPKVNRSVTIVNNNIILTFFEGEDVLPGDILSICKGRLADYSVPIIKHVEKLPTDSNGKIDRKALLQLEIPTQIESFSLTAVENGVSEIWMELLGINCKIGPEQNFFEIGGNSIIATKVITNLRERLGISLTMRELYANPTIRGCAREEETNEAKTEPKKDNRKRLSNVNYVKHLFFIFALSMFTSSFIPPMILWNLSNIKYKDKYGPLFAILFFPLTVLVYMSMVFMVKKMIGDFQSGIVKNKYKWILFDRLWELLIMVIVPVFSDTAWLPAFYRMFGAKIGKNVILSGTILRCPEMITIGDNVHVSNGVLLLDRIENPFGDIILDRISMSNNVVVSDNSVVEGGSNITVNIPPLTYVSRNGLHPEPMQTSSPNGPLPDDSSLFLDAISPLMVNFGGIVRVIGVFYLLQLITIYPRVESILIAIFGGPLAIIVLYMLEVLSVALFRRLILFGKAKEQTLKIHSLKFYRHWWASKSIERSANFSMFTPSFLTKLACKINGSKIQVFDDGAFFKEPQEPDLYEEKDCHPFHANGVQISNYKFNSGYVEMGNVTIGKNCIVLDRSVLKSGVKIGDNVTIGTITNVDVNVNDSTLLLGNPPINVPRNVAVGDPKDEKLLQISIGVSQCLTRIYIIWLFFYIPLYSYAVPVLMRETLWEKCLILSVGIPITLPFLFTIWIFLLFLMKRVLVGNFKNWEGKRFPIRTFDTFLWKVYEHMYDQFAAVILMMLDDSILNVKFLRLFGSKVGEGSWIHSSALNLETDLLEVGKCVEIREKVTTFAHMFQNGEMLMKKVKIGNHCKIGQMSVILPGATLEDEVLINPLSHILSEERLTKGYYGGSPVSNMNLSIMA